MNVASWPMLLLAIVVYGFAPGFLLRLIVLAYKHDDPRREELIAELYAVPRLKRPFWVAEQLETALFDGLVPRIRWTLTGRIILRWHLKSGVKMNRKHPDTFWIPSEEEKAAVQPGTIVRLMFQQSDGWVERMWVVVEKVSRRRLVGWLDNQPLDFPRLYPGKMIKFRSTHIIDIAGDPVPVCAECEPTILPVCSSCGSRSSAIEAGDTPVS